MKQPTAVFSVLDTSAMGGAEAYLLSNLFYLADHGHPVILATNSQAVKEYLAVPTNNDSKIILIDMPFRIDAIGNWKGLLKFCILAPRFIFWLFKIRKQYLSRFSQITCLLPGFSDRLFFSPFLKKWGYRLIWLEYGPLEPTFARNWGFPRWLYYQTKHLPERIITISETTKRSLIKAATISSKKILVVYPGVSSVTDSQLAQNKKAAQDWRKQHRLQNQKIVLGVGRLSTEKEFDVLLKAFAKLRKRSTHLATHLILVGDGPARAELEQLAHTLHIVNHVTFTGFVSESKKATLYTTADVFVFPSDWPLEGFGMTTIEAMSWGVPVITTGSGPQAEIITDGKEGLHFTPQNTTELATSLEKLLTNSALAKRFSTNARRKASQLFAAERMHQQILATID